MTLGGMAAAVGLIIDDAIVMVEHIMRRLRGRRERGRPTSRVLQRRARIHPSAGRFVGCPRSSSSLPLAFLTGVTGAFFKALSLTMASALVISFLVAWLAVPLLADHLLSAEGRRPRGRRARSRERVHRRLPPG